MEQATYLQSIEYREVYGVSVMVKSFALFRVVLFDLVEWYIKSSYDICSNRNELENRESYILNSGKYKGKMFLKNGHKVGIARIMQIRDQETNTRRPGECM